MERTTAKIKKVEHPTGKATENGKYHRNKLPSKQKRIYKITQTRRKWRNDEIEQHIEKVFDLIPKANLYLN